MAYDVGFDFRATSGYVTDTGVNTYVLAETSSQTRGGATFICDSGMSGRDRSLITDVRLAGINFNEFANTGTWTLSSLPAGTYDIRCASGDAGNPQSTNTVAFKDNTTPLFTLSGATSAGDFRDANGSTYSAANWPASNTARSVTINSGTLNVVCGDGVTANTGFIAHIQVTLTAATSTVTKPMWPMSFF